MQKRTIIDLSKSKRKLQDSNEIVLRNNAKLIEKNIK